VARTGLRFWRGTAPTGEDTLAADYPLDKRLARMAKGWAGLQHRIRVGVAAGPVVKDSEAMTSVVVAERQHERIDDAGCVRPVPVGDDSTREARTKTGQLTKGHVHRGAWPH
jgi:hypothetical protein